MTGLNSWLSANVMHALGWALIHSLWQCAGVAALAALAMAFIRRPHLRYLIGVGALALMLAAPVATFLVLAKPAAPVPVLQPAPMPARVSASVLPVTPPPSTPVAVFATVDRAILAEAPRQFPVGDMLPWLVAAWACGVAFFSLRFAGGFLLLEHRRRTQSHIPGERVLALCLDLQRRLGLDRAIQYLECEWVQAPAVIGWLRPAVLMPVFALTGLSEEQFRAVIAHELAHIRRHDWFVNLFQVLVEALLFYHPAMWWLNRRIRIERELCCDEIAVSLTGSRLEYARALAQMAEWKNVSMLAMAANRGPLTQRILHILGRKPSGAGQRVAGLTGGMLFLFAALAAANLLFGIAYPIPAAKAEVRAVLVSSQNAALRMARQVFQVSGPAAKIAPPPMAAPDKVEVAADAQPENLVAPAPDLSRLLPNQSLATPTVVASNAAPAAPQPSPNDSPAMALNNQPVAPLTTREFDRHAEAGQPSRPLTEGSSAVAADSGPAAAAPMGALSPPVTRTEPAMACLLGLSHWLCQHHFFAMRAMMSFPRGVPTRGVPNCVDERHPNAWPKQPAFDDSRCPHGVLEAVHYLGRNARGDDVYAVQYRHSSMTYVLQQPNPDGKVEEYWDRNIPSYITAVPSQNAHKVALYRRPAQSSDPSDRQAANAPPATTPDDQSISLASGAAPQPGKMVRPAGDAHITRRNSTDYVSLAALESGIPARSRTELAMKCSLGLLGYEGCSKSDSCNGGMGPVEKVEYLGGTAADADVYRVRYRFEIVAYTVAPDTKGKTGEYLIKSTDHYWIGGKISPPAAPILIYARPENAGTAGCRGDYGVLHGPGVSDSQN